MIKRWKSFILGERSNRRQTQNSRQLQNEADFDLVRNDRDPSRIVNGTDDRDDRDANGTDDWDANGIVDRNDDYNSDTGRDDDDGDDDTYRDDNDRNNGDTWSGDAVSIVRERRPRWSLELCSLPKGST